ncbi:hypothetical protein QFC21_003028 [Naganishia friedmannii]|uniref:Uncharacterized protein n=1 Tax=Naganishia friedmannii TaxID=89922 RepID=A0ACC2VRK4_9TREE|nr:hypothetical protein QFC21_003028 [Naganishia friedmannii]
MVQRDLRYTQRWYENGMREGEEENDTLRESCDELQMTVTQREEQIQRLQPENAMLVAQKEKKGREPELQVQFQVNGMEWYGGPAANTRLDNR